MSKRHICGQLLQKPCSMGEFTLDRPGISLENTENNNFNNLIRLLLIIGPVINLPWVTLIGALLSFVFLLLYFDKMMIVGFLLDLAIIYFGLDAVALI